MGLEGLGRVWREWRKGERCFMLYIIATNSRHSDIAIEGCKWKLLKL